jgi:hypothetical protein
MSNSVRHLYTRNARKVLGLPSHTKHLLQDAGEDTPANPGDMIMNSFFAPALDADTTYTISATQTDITIVPPDGGNSYKAPDISNQNPQVFKVSAPQWALESGDIHSVYPAPAQSEYPNILPHVIFNDPHLPWERGSRYSTAIADPLRNKVPWLAVLVFDGEAELKLNSSDLAPISAGGLFPNDMFANNQTVKQDNTSYAIGMTWTQLNEMTGVSKQIDSSTPPDDPTAALSVIFPPAPLYAALFQSSTTKKGNLDKYRYFAHYRNINTAGMAGAGVQDTGFFSVIMSSRTGPTSITTPKNMVAHIVSLDGIPEYGTFPKNPIGVRASMISLYSWTYQCLPPAALNFVGSMENISKQSTALLKTPGPPGLSPLMQDRLDSGFSLIRYRVQTGEETAAFFRGPLVPAPVEKTKFTNWPAMSNTSESYQILDTQTGLMDLSYSTAWQLGRTLAIADQSFASALTRFRSVCFAAAWNNTKQRVMGATWKSKDDTMKGLVSTVDLLSKLHLSDHLGSKHNHRNRWCRPAKVVNPTFSLQDEDVNAIFQEELAKVIKTMTSATVTKDPKSDVVPYNEFNFPLDKDWPIVLAWIMDKKFLHNIPAHYLITDPWQVPMESIRFFYIDTVWVDCLIDGALSVANHSDIADVGMRQGIKDSVTTFLTTALDSTVQPLYYPQVPSCGFFLRSAIVTAIPDMRVSAEPPRAHDVDVLRHETIDKATMYCLMDRYFDANDLSAITFAQPPHQQCFSLGYNLTAAKVEILFRKAYNNPADPPQATDKWDDLLSAANPFVGKPTDPNPVYDWKTNLVLIDNLIPVMVSNLQTVMGDKFLANAGDQPSGLGSATVALEFNEAIFFMSLAAAKPTVDSRKSPSPLDEWSTSSNEQYQVLLRKPTKGRKHSKKKHKHMQRHHLPEHTKSFPSAMLAKNPKYPTVKPATPRLSGEPPIDYDGRPKVGAGPAPSSKFNFLVFPAEGLLKHNRSMPMPLDSPITVDVIFSLLLGSDVANTDLWLRSILIYIPTGPMQPPQPHPAPKIPYTNLMTGYQGSGCRMLANPRWLISIGNTVAFSPTSKQKMPCLALTLLPRSTKFMMRLADTADCSFVLGMIDVDPTPGQIEVWGVENYWYFPPGGGAKQPRTSPLQFFVNKAATVAEDEGERKSGYQ